MLKYGTESKLFLQLFMPCCDSKSIGAATPNPKIKTLQQDVKRYTCLKIRQYSSVNYSSLQILRQKKILNDTFKFRVVLLLLCLHCGTNHIY